MGDINEKAKSFAKLNKSNMRILILLFIRSSIQHKCIISAINGLFKSYLTCNSKSILYFIFYPHFGSTTHSNLTGIFVIAPAIFPFIELLEMTY